MDARQHRRAAELFERARAVPADERASFVATECADDPEVRAQVLAILDRLDDPVTDATVGRAAPLAGLIEAIATAPLPERIDRYRVIRLLGEGGMGRVFECEQDSPRRRVAVKLLRPGMVRPAMLRRFRHEAEVLGRLVHPGIAQIFDAGTWDAGDGAQPYFALEYVEGIPLDRHAESRGLDLPGRLRLLLEVCEAVQYAHDRGVIHRDLKPDNILVDAEGRPRVLDFGVARSTDADLEVTSMHTATGQMLGTLQYMSPEQCGARPDELDVRSDVYALGVLLFELLCGRTPYDDGGMALPEAVRVIREQSPSRPSTIDRQLRGDLDTILLTALEKEPERRYPSVRALADDLRRHLADEPILARPPSTFYQLRKLARRHRSAVAALALLGVGLVFATILSVGFALSESSARQAAERSEALANDRAAELEAVNAFMERMLEQADPWKSGGEVSIATAIERAGEVAAASFPGRPGLEARVRTTLGRTLVGLGQREEGVVELERAVALATAAGGPDDLRTLRARLELGRGLHAEGRDEEAAALLREVLAAAEARTEAAGAEVDSTGSPPSALVIDAHHALGRVVHRLGRWDEADRMGTLALEAAIRRHGPGADEIFAIEPLLAWNDLFRGRTDAAIDRFRRLEERVRSRHGEDSHLLVPILNGLGQSALDQQRHDDAEARFRRALALSRATFADGHPDVMVALNGLANVMMVSDRADEALPFMTEAVDIVRARLGPDHQNTHVVMGNLGALHGRLGRFDDADRVLRDVLEARRRTLPADSPGIAKSYEQLGAMMYRGGRFDEAVELLDRGRAIYAVAFEGPTAESIACLSNLASALRRVGRHEEAIEVIGEVLEFDRRDLGPDHPIVGDGLISLAGMLLATGAVDEARPHVDAASAIAATTPDAPRRAGRAALLRSRIAKHDGAHAAAGAELETAWRDLAASGDLDEAIPHAASLAETLRAAGDEADAERWTLRVDEATAD